jgi:hypothetical protein
VIYKQIKNNYFFKHLLINNLKIVIMKKFLLIFAAVLLTAISADVFAQGLQQTVTINSTRNYWVNSAAYETAPTTNDGSTYVWSVYDWDGSGDYMLPSWTATPATGDYSVVAGGNVYNAQLKWLVAGSYVVEVVETNTSCTTVRRFGVKVIDLDLLVVTKDHLGDIITTAGVYCNTDEGNIYGDGDDDNLNNSGLVTMIMTYEISLYTVKGSIAPADLIGTALNTAAWKFTAVDASTIPAAPGNVTWTVTGGTGTYTTGGTNVISVPAGTSTVTITAEIKNIAAENTANYVLGFNVGTATVLIENGGTAGDYLEGQEPSTYDGILDVLSHKNAAVGITVKPIPNTTKIKFN